MQEKKRERDRDRETKRWEGLENFANSPQTTNM